MKIDMTKLKPNKNPYMEMHFSDLVSTIFMPDGEVKCHNYKAILALITRLKQHYPSFEFGNIETGQLHEMDAFLVASLIQSHEIRHKKRNSHSKS